MVAKAMRFMLLTAALSCCLAISVKASTPITVTVDGVSIPPADQGGLIYSQREVVATCDTGYNFQYSLDSLRWKHIENYRFEFSMESCDIYFRAKPKGIDDGRLSAYRWMSVPAPASPLLRTTITPASATFTVNKDSDLPNKIWLCGDGTYYTPYLVFQLRTRLITGEYSIETVLRRWPTKETYQRGDPAVNEQWTPIGAYKASDGNRKNEIGWYVKDSGYYQIQILGHISKYVYTGTGYEYQQFVESLVTREFQVFDERAIFPKPTLSELNTINTNRVVDCSDSTLKITYATSFTKKISETEVKEYPIEVYLIKNGVSYPNGSALLPGTYAVDIEHVDNGVTKCRTRIGTDAIVAKHPQRISYVAEVTQPQCLGDQPKLAIKKSQSDVMYSIDNNSWHPISSAMNMQAGNYNVRVRYDDGLCEAAPADITVNPQPTLLRLSDVVVTPVSECGTKPGSCSFKVLGNKAPYVARIAGIAKSILENDSVTFDNLQWGDYTLSVRSATGCTLQYPFTITGARALEMDIVDSEDITTCDEHGEWPANGSLTLACSGGVMPYNFFFNEQLTLPDRSNGVNFYFKNLQKGNYTIRIEDAEWCAQEVEHTVNAPSKPTLLPQADIALLCFDDTTQVQLQADSTVGATPFRYTLEGTLMGSTTQTSAVFSKLTAMEYSGYIVDNEGCKSNEITFEVVQPQRLRIDTILLKDVFTCKGGSNGEAQVLTSGGTTPYSFTLYKNDTLLTTGITNSFDQLPAGSYRVQVADANGCTTEKIFELSEPEVFLLEQLVSTNITSCYGRAEGQLLVQLRGGVSPYYISLSSESYSRELGSSGDTLLQKLPAGLYSLSISDATGCSLDSTISITQPTQLALTSVRVKPVEDCSDNATGQIAITLAGGSAPYTASLSSKSIGRTATLADSCTFDTLYQGMYTLKLSDSHGCTLTQQVAVSGDNVLQFTNRQIISAEGCVGVSNGSLSATIEGGFEPLQLFFNDNDISHLLNNGAFSVSGLPKSSNVARVVDGKGCSAYWMANVDGPDSLKVVSVQAGSIRCHGVAEGKVKVHITGGTAPYSYTVGSITQQNENFQNLTAGNYAIRVTDKHACEVSALAVVTQPQILSIEKIKAVNVNGCAGDASGSFTLTATGGVQPYTYTVYDEQGVVLAQAKQPRIEKLRQGRYKLSVADAKGCTAETWGEIQGSQPLQVSEAQVVNTQYCAAAPNGSITLGSVSGGIQPYMYSLNGGGFSINTQWNGLTKGEHTVTIRDKAGCTLNQKVFVNATQPLQVAPPLVNNVTGCAGSANGSISLVATGGDGSYQYSYNLGKTYSTSSHIDSLKPGTYHMVVRDGSGCVVNTKANVTEPAPIKVTYDVTLATCPQASDGKLVANVTGGILPYTYSWTYWGRAVGSEATLDSVYGTYMFRLTDAQGCATRDAQLSTVAGSPLNRFNLRDSVLLCYGEKYQLDLSSLDGAFSWTSDNGFSSSKSKVTLQDAGSYHLTYTKNGCSWEHTMVLDRQLVPRQAEFLALWEVSVGASVELVDVSFPAPDRVQWNIPNNMLVVGKRDAANLTVYPLKAGEYEVELVSYYRGCESRITRTIKAVNGVVTPIVKAKDKNVKPELITQHKVYPNPTGGTFYVEVLLSQPMPVTLELYNVRGVKVYETVSKFKEKQHTVEVATPNVPTGTYVQVVRCGDTMSSAMIFINRQ